jgi:hypothetical protein
LSISTDSAAIRRHCRQILRHVKVESDAGFVLEEGFHQFAYLPNDGVDGESRNLQIDSPGFRLGDIEDPVDELEQVLAAGLDSMQSVLLVFIERMNVGSLQEAFTPSLLSVK